MRSRLRLSMTFLVACGMACVGDDPELSTRNERDDGGVVQPPLEDAATDDVRDDGGVVQPPLEDAATDDVAPPCSVLYVVSGIPAGNTGCAPNAALPSISGALAAAKVRPGVKEIRVCGGTYSETALLLDRAVSIFGGYECTTFTADAGGQPTIVVNGNAALQESTLSIKGEAVGRDVVVAGLTVQGADVSTGSSLAMEIADGAAPTIRDNVVLGGSASAGRSTGLAVRRQASPEVHDNVIRGGAGTPVTGTASVGALAATNEGAAPWFHDNAIESGRGTSTTATATVGLLVTGNVSAKPLTAATKTAIERNTIRGGSGSFSGLSSGIGSCGLFLSTASAVDIIDNVIEAGSGSGTNAANGGVDSIGLRILQSSESILVERNRIIAGNGGQATVTIFVSDPTAGAITIDNNFLAGSGRSTTTPAHGRVLVLYDVDAKPAVHIRNNTILAPVVTIGPSVILDFGGAAGTVVQNNVFVARAETDVVVEMPCPSPTAVSSFENNYFVSPSNLLGSGTGCTPSRNVSDLEAALRAGSSATVANNVRVAASCDGDTDPGCRQNTACVSAGDCARTLFAAFTGTGVADLAGPGLRLKPGASCLVVQGGLDLGAAGVTLDAFGAPRTAGFSRGAHELDDAGCTSP